MDAGLAWTIVGSVAGVAAVGTGVVLGVLQLRQGRKNASLPASGDPAQTSGQGNEFVPGGQTARAVKGNEQIGRFIRAYLQDLHAPSPRVSGSLGGPQRRRPAPGLRQVHLRAAGRSQAPHRRSYPAPVRRVAVMSQALQTLAQPPASHRSRPHPAAQDHARKRSTPGSVLAGQGLFAQMVAGVGFEPT
jgi:hypothetical protein